MQKICQFVCNQHCQTIPDKIPCSALGAFIQHSEILEPTQSDYLLLGSFPSMVGWYYFPLSLSYHYFPPFHLLPCLTCWSLWEDGDMAATSEREGDAATSITSGQLCIPSRAFMWMLAKQRLVFKPARWWWQYQWVLVGSVKLEQVTLVTLVTLVNKEREGLLRDGLALHLDCWLGLEWALFSFEW